MVDIVKLKKKAVDFEAKKAFDKALATYMEVIGAYESGEEEPIDIPLFNRVGDLAQKTGNLPEAISLWEKAVDHYSEGGFYNPAIALCNKILRASPGRTVIYYKLGKISAAKGFTADARANFLEYARRQQKAGNFDDAFKALKEFTNLVPGQHDVRLMLADQLVKAARKDEAIEQLQLGYQQTEADGDSEAGEKFVAKMKELDPDIEPRSAKAEAAASGGGLVFLDVDDEDHEAHYDLGVTYKEMGLLDEAIAEFQKALRGTTKRVRTFESLGHCFVEQEQLPAASSILQRALAEPGVRDESLVGVLYLLGTIAEQLGAFQDAKKHFERVLAVDMQFRDIGDRLNAVEQHLT